MKNFLFLLTISLLLFEISYSQDITFDDFKEYEDRFISVETVTHGLDRKVSQIPYYVLVDLHTGVQYLGMGIIDNGGVTVIVNEDGRPEKLSPSEIVPSLIQHINMKFEQYNEVLESSYVPSERKLETRVKVQKINRVLERIKD